MARGLLIGTEPLGSVARYSAQHSAGARLWVRRSTGPGTHADRAYSVAVSPGGKRVFVTGESDGHAGAGIDYAT